MDYVKDGTLTIQARTIKEVNSIDRVVVYADGCQREYLMPLPIEEGKWKVWHRSESPKAYYGECSICNGKVMFGTDKPFKWCPYCGAKMNGE